MIPAPKPKRKQKKGKHFELAFIDIPGEHSYDVDLGLTLPA